MKNKERAWFIEDDGRAPQTLYVMYDHRVCGSKIRFMEGAFVNLEQIGIQIFNVEDNKWGKLEHILKWDFLPNSTGIPLANEKALKVLEEVAYGEFQAIPTEIKLPDGQVITEYKLINVINLIEGINFEKCIEDPKYNGDRIEISRYDIVYHDSKCLGISNLARDKTLYLSVIYGSNKLKNIIKSSELTGLVFKEKSGLRHRFLEE